MNTNFPPNHHPKFGNGRGYHRRHNGRKRKRQDKERLEYAMENPSRCSKLAGVYEKNGRLEWYSYHQKCFRKQSDAVLRSKPNLEIPSGSHYKKIYDYAWECI